MAKKGIRYAVFGILDEQTGTYSGGKCLSPVAGYNGTPNNSSVKDYGDDHAVEVENSVVGGTLDVELNDDSDEIYTMLLGHTKDTEGKIIYNADDEAPYVGSGAIGKSGSKWVAKFYKKVKFSEPNDENSTKQESTTFGHVNLSGDIIIPENGEWKLRETFDTLAEAKTWLNGLVGITSTGGNTEP